MTDKQIMIDDYFTECTDGGGGTIGYHLISETALIKKIREQNAYIQAKEQECEELKKELQAQRAFTRHEQKLIYCVAYDETCKTGNDCKQKKCIFKDNIKLKQTLAKIKEMLLKTPTDSQEHCVNIKSVILQKISEVIDEEV